MFVIVVVFKLVSTRDKEIQKKNQTNDLKLFHSYVFLPVIFLFFYYYFSFFRDRDKKKILKKVEEQTSIEKKICLKKKKTIIDKIISFV